ncbi:hypothetical protein, variant 1 [Aphanomyces invadans]|uniref:Transmembrane protein n=1 Tax=Aphanomyces invadans TaxID=157072 RepID=A0A024UCT8_9STRA|nr:hypothetical protein, variant 1 [Aphanomyces invadans]ETW03707.1 hypothetical protein, variant 1 [Aphanomyces invadans]|eukprot:XP_008867936.1 hypothetical protein, variant 1 [Aphanomyces invadans]
MAQILLHANYIWPEVAYVPVSSNHLMALLGFCPSRSSVGHNHTTHAGDHHGSTGESGHKVVEKSTRVQTLLRVASNVIASMLLFLPMLTLAVLIYQVRWDRCYERITGALQGMYNRLIVSHNFQTTAMYWNNYSQSCELTQAGWVADSCDSMSSKATPATAWTSIGTVLATQWAQEIADAGGTLKVTTCAVGGTDAVGWGNLQFIGGYDAYPACIPTAPQDIAGIAMLESTIRPAQPNGVYMLTLYADMDSTMTVMSYQNSDGTAQNVMANPKRTLIAMDGLVTPDPSGENNIIYSRPLGERYLVTGYCVPQIEELSVAKTDNNLPGWSQGKHSKHPVTTAWACGHRVSNWKELVALQMICSLATMALFAGDIYITVEGFRGVLQGKPVLTYAVLAGLERRKMLLVAVVVNCMPGLLYMDVSRIYFFTTNGYRIWCLASVMMASFFAFGVVLVLSFLDAAVTCRLEYVVGYSAPLFLHGAIVATTTASCIPAVFEFVYNKIYAAKPALTVELFGQAWPCGSYTVEGTPAVMTYLIWEILHPLIASFVAAVVVAALLHKYHHHSYLTHVTWCQSNAFLRHAGVPNWITSLPLEQTNAIKIGTKVFCKPSTQALMGYSSLVALRPQASTFKSVQPDHGAPAGSHSQGVFYVVSIYALLPSTVVPWLCQHHGTIEHYQFTPAHGHSRLAPDKAATYVHSRGACTV